MSFYDGHLRAFRSAVRLRTGSLFVQLFQHIVDVQRVQAGRAPR
jgi:hypothetical protein